MKNTGLHYTQIFDGYDFQTGNSGEMAVNNMDPGSPGLLLTGGVVSLGSDDKVFLESSIANARMFNNSNIPVVVRLVYYVVRKDIPATSYPDLETLLTDGAPQLTSIGGGDPLTSNAAQRYLKWTKMKKKILYPAKMMMWKCKGRGHRFISGDYDGDSSAYFNVKGNRGVLCFVDGIPIEGVGATANNVAISSWSVQITHAHKLTWRVAEENQNTSVISQNWPALTGEGDVVVPDTEVEPVTQA